MNVDVQILDDRLDELDARKRQSIEFKREEALMKEVMIFMHQIRPSRDFMSLTCCTPVDIKRFLVWKDKHGKSQVHRVECAFLGKKKVCLIAIAQFG